LAVAFDLHPTEEQAALKEMLSEFAREVLRPAARDSEAARRTSDEVRRQVHDLGVAAPVPEEFGGGGSLDAVTYAMAAEELAFGDPGIAYHVLGTGLPAIVLALGGSEDQKKRFLPGFADDRPPSSFVASAEKVAAGDLESLETTIEGGVVNGTKYGVLEAGDAGIGIVVGRSSHGLAAAIVGPESFEVVKPEDKLGIEAAPTSVVSFDGEAEPLGGESLGSALLWSKLMTGAVALGCARASLEYASQYAIEREAFGKAIGAFQGISFKIADMAILVDAARVSLWRAAWKIDRGEATLADVAEATGQALEASLICGDDGVQVLGGHGYVRDHPVEKWFRDAVTLSVFDAPELIGDVMVARSVEVG
jgi:alkylation response protein AidB-like acyl-CoA dehydrogenase